MEIPVRRLRKGASGYTTDPDTALVRRPQTREEAARSVTEKVGYAVGRSIDIPKVTKAIAESREKATTEVLSNNGLIETADAGTGAGASSGSMIKPRTMYASVLEGFLYTDVESSDNNILGNRTKDSSLNRIFRDIYYHDPVCGSAVDLMSNMPFSDFSLSGAKDRKVYRKFEESINNMNVKALLPRLSNEYMVHGLFVSTTLFDTEEGVYTGIVPQNLDYVDIMPVPVFGRDPLITLQVGEAAKVIKSNDERMQRYAELFPSEQEFKPKPEDVIFIPRSGLMRDFRGVSIYRRVLSAWLVERALYRGTIDQSMKRQRPVTHMTVGEEEWTPTQEEMSFLADNLLATDMDPVGSVFVTRTGVQIADVRDANSMWKVSDLESYFTTLKLRSLGVSESFLAGDANYNSMEQAMTVFVEQMRAYREMISYELFYDRTFARISQTNGYMHRRYAIAETANTLKMEEQMYRHAITGRAAKYHDGAQFAPQFVLNFEGAASAKDFSRENREDLFIPQVHWHKRLRPEADSEFLGLLTTLQEQGIPVPVRIWAGAAGQDLDSIMAQKDEDMRIREKMKEWMKEIKPPEEGMSGEGGGGGMDLSSASLINSFGGVQRKSILSRKFDPDKYGVQNVTSDGKRHLLSAKGAKVLEERINKKIAEVGASINKKLNAIDRILERERIADGTSKIYT